MFDFGYTISKQRVIELDKNNKKFAEQVSELEPSFNLCIGCGTCTSTCSVNQFDEFNLRRLILLVKRGELDKVAGNVQQCMLCGKCQLACPRGVNTRNVVLSIGKICKIDSNQ